MGASIGSCESINKLSFLFDLKKNKIPQRESDDTEKE